MKKAEKDNMKERQKEEVKIEDTVMTYIHSQINLTLKLCKTTDSMLTIM